MSAHPPRLALLDVNVLIALAWPNHVQHSLAQDWFAAHHHDGWGTTPVTEAGFVRVSSNRSAIATATAPALARQLLVQMCEITPHEFLADDVSGVIGPDGDPQVLVSHRDVIDAHLLAVAERHRARLVTLDTGTGRLLRGRDPRLLEILRPSS